MVVGVSGYEMVPKLKYAAKDARDVAAGLRQVGFEDDKVILLEDESGDARPHRSSVFHHLAELNDARLDDDDLLLFYFSGHGMSEGGADYLLPIDASNRDLKNTGLAIKKIMERLRETGSHQVVMLIDACRDELPTGKSVAGIGASTQSVLEKQFDDGLAVIFSCDSTQRSFEIDGDDIKQGAFTHCVLEAIKSPTISTVGEMASYLGREVQELNARRNLGRQKPYLLAKPEALKDLVLFGRLYDEIDEYRKFFLELWDGEQLSPPTFYSVMDFLDEPPYEHRSMKLIRECYKLVSSPRQFERSWKHFRKPSLTAAVRDQGPVSGQGR